VMLVARCEDDWDVAVVFHGLPWLVQAEEVSESVDSACRAVASEDNYIVRVCCIDCFDDNLSRVIAEVSGLVSRDGCLCVCVAVQRDHCLCHIILNASNASATRCPVSVDDGLIAIWTGELVIVADDALSEALCFALSFNVWRVHNWYNVSHDERDGLGLVDEGAMD
jgi:hypothetical protein